MIRIMIVDDMPLFLEYLRGCIDWNSYGFEICCEAHDGREALEKIEEFYPDVVLTDITMPYVNGLELAEKVTRDYPEISVILITGNNEFEYARRAVKLGVCDYIVKPFEKEELSSSPVWAASTHQVAPVSLLGEYSYSRRIPWTEELGILV